VFAYGLELSLIASSEKNAHLLRKFRQTPEVFISSPAAPCIPKAFPVRRHGCTQLASHYLRHGCIECSQILLSFAVSPVLNCFRAGRGSPYLRLVRLPYLPTLPACGCNLPWNLDFFLHHNHIFRCRLIALLCFCIFATLY
jgi:hypothetical protein